MLVLEYTDRLYWQVGGLINRFYDEVLGKIDNLADRQLIDLLIERYKKDAFVLVADEKVVGVIAGQEEQFGMSVARHYREVFFYILPEYRRLIRGFLRCVETRLKRKGYHAIIMCYLNRFYSEGLGRLYAKEGYEPLEVHLIKQLGAQNGL